MNQHPHIKQTTSMGMTTMIKRNVYDLISAVFFKGVNRSPWGERNFSRSERKLCGERKFFNRYTQKYKKHRENKDYIAITTISFYISDKSF